MRPKDHSLDNLSKLCQACGQRFWLRDRPHQSRARFAVRKFCSSQCAEPSGPDTDQTLSRFMARVEKTDDCWNWTGAVYPKGYGVFNVGNGKVRAHRYSYKQFVGEIPDGLMLLHSCDNPRCVNPAHLRAGTAQENLADAFARGRRRGKLIDHSDPRIWQGSIADAARECGVSYQTIWRRRRQTT